LKPIYPQAISGILDQERKMAHPKFNIVKGPVPETFVIVWNHPEIPNEGFIQTSDAMSEADMRKELEKRMIAKADIDTLIKEAR
jgi:hypothetical protein